MKYIIKLKDVSLSNVGIVGGKNAATGEMIQNLTRLGIRCPDGFATTVNAYSEFLAQNNLNVKISNLLSTLNINNIKALDKASLQIRRWIIGTPFFPNFDQELAHAYKNLPQATVAVRSSATTEDMDNASFAGAQETFLNIKGIHSISKAVKLVYASLFTSRAIAYRKSNVIPYEDCAMSVGIQPMIRSDKGASGVMFTLDTESGFDKVILISSSYGLGEGIVQGKVNPDEFMVSKSALLENKSAILQRTLGEKAVKVIYSNSKNPKLSIKTVNVTENLRTRFSLTDKEVHALAHQGLLIERYFGKPMDIEWAKDGLTQQLYILQARPETVNSQLIKTQSIETYVLSKKSNIIVEGQSIGQKIGAGIARIIFDPKHMNKIKPGDVLVTDMTDPDWEPIMKLASAIVTNRGGRTCHAAIIARELGIPAVVGARKATQLIAANKPITVSCAEGQTGYVYNGKLPFKINKISVKNMPKIPVKLCINMGSPERAFTAQFLPNEGVGLARLEFIIANKIGIHPNAAINFNKLSSKLKQQIGKKTVAYKNPVEFYIEKLREGISTIAAAFHPKEVIFRFSDFKTNEYASLLGGAQFEPSEENPMLGFRGASRYIHDNFRKAFELECQAFTRVRDEMGLLNAHVMIPFVRTVSELKEVIKTLADLGLKRGKNGLKIYMMCEIPANVLLATEFLAHVDGFSIGSNDLTQLTLGLDRDSAQVANLFDERNPAIKKFLHEVIQTCKKQGKYVGICGQGPSDHPDFAKWLMEEGIDCMSLNADTLVQTWLMLAGQEK